MPSSCPPLTIPPELKKITQYIRRAEELDRDTLYPESRLVAYYLRQYAVQIGIPLLTTTSSTSSTAAAKKCLGDILSQLEKEKSTMNNFSKKESKFLCRTFADRVLEKANQQESIAQQEWDEHQNSNPKVMEQHAKEIAQAFYAAATFYDILQQFSTSSKANESTSAATGKDISEESLLEQEEEEEENKKRLYCKYKATEILKALKEGRSPISSTSTGSTSEDPEQQDMNTVKKSNSLSGNESWSSGTAEYSKAPLTGEGTEVNLDGAIIPSAPSFSFPVQSLNHIEDHNISSTSAVSCPPTTMDSSAPSSSSFSLKNLVRGKSNSSASKAQINDARELTQFALAALDAKDVSLAIERLESALESLGHKR